MCYGVVVLRVLVTQRIMEHGACEFLWFDAQGLVSPRVKWVLGVADDGTCGDV